MRNFMLRWWSPALFACLAGLVAYFFFAFGIAFGSFKSAGAFGPALVAVPIAIVVGYGLYILQIYIVCRMVAKNMPPIKPAEQGWTECPIAQVRATGLTVDPYHGTGGHIECELRGTRTMFPIHIPWWLGRHFFVLEALSKELTHTES